MLDLKYGETLRIAFHSLLVKILGRSLFHLSWDRLERLRQYFPARAMAIDKIKAGEVVQLGDKN